MNAMIDAGCEKCGRRFGWHGRMANQPACPRCGHRPPQADLDAADARMDEDRKLVASRPDRERCRRQRVLAGLTLRQAAARLGLSPTALSAIEQGASDLPGEVAAAMAALYGCGEEQTSVPPSGGPA